MKSLLHMEIKDIALRTPNRLAVRASDGEITYAQMDRLADAVAARLREAHGVRTGTIVALLMHPGVAYVTGMLAVWKAGGVCLPLDPGNPPRQRQAWIAKARPTVVVADAACASACEAGESAVPVLRIDGAMAGDAAKLPLSVTGDDANYIIFTSGTTGEPKGIVGSHKGLSHFIHWEVKEFGLGPEDRISQLAPPTFDVSLRDMFAPLLAGGTLCIPAPDTRRNIRALLDWLDDERITLIHCVPSLFRALTEEIARRAQRSSLVPALRYVLLAGEPLYSVDVQRWRAAMGLRVELVNLYGPSETTLAKACHRIADVPGEPGRMIPVGHPLPNTALLIIRDGKLCDKGEIGELFIKTPFMTKGYLDAPAATEAGFVQNPLTPEAPDRIFRTGDMGRYRADRSVELLGRRDGQVKVNGIRVELAEVEQALLQSPAVRETVVLAHAGVDRQVFLTAYFTAESRLSDEALRAHLREWLDPSVHPAFFVQMETFPLNLHGKINRRALPRPVDLLYRERPCIAPTGEAESAVAAIWGEILDIPKIGVTHSFVELGGDSLKAIRVVARIAQRLGVELKLPELFPRGTVREIAAIVTRRRESEMPLGPVRTIASPTADEMKSLQQ
jgi:amino acid adenylation domain-containing protein